MTFEFKPWPKIPRLNREMIITEKIDGTNAAVVVSEDGSVVGAQSRNRIITPDDDNYGFAKWVYGNAGALADTLGPGYHYGEWWGSGIQRGYGLPKGEKRFSLFNVTRWDEIDLDVEGLGVVPALFTGVFDTETILYYLGELQQLGSAAAPGFDRPEGVVVFHTAAQQVFKVLIENDELPKGAVA